MSRCVVRRSAIRTATDVLAVAAHDDRLRQDDFAGLSPESAYPRFHGFASVGPALVAAFFA